MSDGTATTQAKDSRWTADLISGMDWKRIAELARALASASGFVIGKTKVPTSGAAEFVMQQAQDSNARSLVRLAPWNRWMASSDCMRDFVEAVGRESGGTHGIYIAPGGFAETAVLVAKHHGIEMVDAWGLASRLNDLPQDYRDFFFATGMSGDLHTPSCPVCLHPLTLVTGAVESAGDVDQMPELTFKGHVIVGDLVRARRVEVQPSSEVQFLHEVRARDVVVRGIAMGDFHCHGSLVLHPGATLYGRVAARSVDVRDGAELVGETTILQELPSASEPESQPQVSLWRCKNPEAKPRCFAVAFSPHS
jgi:cytoskeletal protein CcmA (bactofilin family)